MPSARKIVEQVEAAGRREETLRQMMSRAGNGFKEYIANELDADEQQAAEGSVEYFEEYLERGLNAGVREDGLVTFWTLEPELESMISDLPVALYHHTSSKLLRRIRRDGLVAGKVDNARFGAEAAGVYLTTETSGPPVNQYTYRAVQRHGGDPVTLTVRRLLSEISPDPDDADIRSGQHQFVTPYVAPADIVEVS